MASKRWEVLRVDKLGNKVPVKAFQSLDEAETYAKTEFEVRGDNEGYLVNEKFPTEEDFKRNMPTYRNLRGLYIYGGVGTVSGAGCLI